MKFKMCGEKVFILAVMLILASVVSADIYIRDNFMFGDVSQQRFCPYIGSLSFSSENTGQFNLLDNSLTFEESSALDRCGVYNTIIAADDKTVSLTAQHPFDELDVRVKVQILDVETTDT